MDKVTRIGVSLEPELLNSFDNYIARKGYPTRSEAIREIVNEVLAKEMIDEGSSHAIGTIILLYNHSKRGINQALMDVQHLHHEVISSSIHIHLDFEKCLEMVIVHGSVQDIKELRDDLNGVKGMLHAELVLISGEPARHEHLHQHQNLTSDRTDRP